MLPLPSTPCWPKLPELAQAPNANGQSSTIAAVRRRTTYTVCTTTIRYQHLRSRTR